MANSPTHAPTDPHDILIAYALVSLGFADYGDETVAALVWSVLSAGASWVAMSTRPGPWRWLAATLAACFAPSSLPYSGTVALSLLPLALWRVVIQWPRVRGLGSGYVVALARSWVMVCFLACLWGMNRVVVLVTLGFVAAAALAWALDRQSWKLLWFRALVVSCVASPLTAMLAPLNLWTAMVVYLPCFVLLAIGLRESSDSRMVSKALAVAALAFALSAI